jgi:3-oxoisoapionate decarboxylase
MRLGISSYTYTWAVGVPGHPPERPLDALDLLRRAAGLGVGVVQIADNLPLHTLPAHEVNALRQTADELGIAIEVGTRGIACAHLLAYLDLAVRLASPILRVVVDTTTHHPPVAEVITSLRALMPAFAGSGTCLAVENHDRFRCAELAHIMEEVDSPHLGICLDTVNSFGALEGPAVTVATLGRWVVNLHVKDFQVQRLGHNMGFLLTGCPAGQGMLDVPWLLHSLRELGRTPNAILELWAPPDLDLKDTIAKEARWARESVAYLRSLIPT